MGTGIFRPLEVIGNRYDVFRMLGQGGIGIVYLVHDRERKEEVALKVLRPEFAKHELALQRFIREVKAVRQIEHPGIVKVHDTGKLGDVLFYTMEYVEGTSLSDLIKKQGPFSAVDALETVAEACDILSAIHEVAIHRDISSDNVMRSKEGPLRILDFGTARIAGQESNLTAVGMHLGKQCYSPPEQMADARSVDARADIYSLGMLLYELLSGKLAYGFESVCAMRPELPQVCDDILRTALAGSPDDRYQTAAEMRDVLKAAAETAGR